MRKGIGFSVALLWLAALAACGGEKSDDNPARLDAKLVGNSADTALREAIEAPIASDPDLTGQANRNAVRPPDRPLSGSVPSGLSPKDEREAALKLVGGRLLDTPAATSSITSTKGAVTLGEKAAQDKHLKQCGQQNLRYDMQWATRLPPDFPIYPGAAVTEAAGTTAKGVCGLRAISFSTGTSLKPVLNFYYTLARRGGYSAEHLEENDASVLGGTRDKDDRAYYVSLVPLDGGGTEVQLIVNGGR
jgi:hypothetical protein